VSAGGTQELVIRFLLGGAIVSAFALLGEIFKPKTFAGIFAAAPSVALTTLALAFVSHGPEYAAAEGRSMLLGALAFVGYAALSMFMVRRRGTPVWLEAGASWVVWFAIALGGWWIVTIVWRA